MPPRSRRKGSNPAAADHAQATELMAEAGVTSRATSGSGEPIPSRLVAEAACRCRRGGGWTGRSLPRSAAAAETASEAPAEPILIEVWRLAPAPPPRGGDRATPVSAAGRRGAARAPTPPPASARHQDRPPRQERRADASAAAGSTPRSWRGANPASAGVRRAATGRTRRAARTGKRRRARSTRADAAPAIAARSGARSRRIRTRPSPSCWP